MPSGINKKQTNRAASFDPERKRRRKDLSFRAKKHTCVYLGIGRGYLVSGTAIWRNLFARPFPPYLPLGFDFLARQSRRVTKLKWGKEEKLLHVQTLARAYARKSNSEHSRALQARFFHRRASNFPDSETDRIIISFSFSGTSQAQDMRSYGAC